MKQFGAILEFTKQRNTDLMKSYHERLAEAHYIVMPQIFEKVASSPSCRFWVSEERAAAVISSIEAGRPLPASMRPNKREMFLEIYRRYLALRLSNPETPLLHLVSRIVHQPAPKFYLTPRTVGEIIYRIKKGCYRFLDNPQHT